MHSCRNASVQREVLRQCTPTCACIMCKHCAAVSSVGGALLPLTGSSGRAHAFSASVTTPRAMLPRKRLGAPETDKWRIGEGAGRLAHVGQGRWATSPSKTREQWLPIL